ncbi:MAG TPA: DNA alkylation repair protein [Fimbriimonas sp.]|nr:DNA alkylation repair protein [Fimbriimonas sp.]
MTYDEAMAQLEALGTEKVRQINAKRGAGENQFGVKNGDIRELAKKIGTDPELASKLWKSGNIDAMSLATFLVKPKALSVEELDQMLGDTHCAQLADWLSTNIVKPHPLKEAQRERWMNSDHDVTARLGWSLTTERVIKDPAGLDLPALLDRIEAEMSSAPSLVQWTMNYCLAEIGIHFPVHRARAISIGERIGAFRDYPVSKGCTSPYAPIWINEMVSRQAS